MAFGESLYMPTSPEKVRDYPIFAEPRRMEKPEQADTVNTIIQSMYDDYSSHTVQRQKRMNLTYRATGERNQLVDYVKDVCYNQFCSLSFDFYSVNIKAGDIVPLLKLNVQLIVNNIICLGLNDLENPTRFLHSYGSFVTTWYEQAKEYQLSFYAYADVPNEAWKVSMQFLAQAITTESNGTTDRTTAQ